EITCYSKDINNTCNNSEPVFLKENDSFDNFDDFYVRRFAEYKGFKVKLGYVKIVDATKSSKWVLQMTKKATNNKYPCVFVTDSNLGMEHAITLEYPEMHHLFVFGDSFEKFYSKFWQYRNADTLYGFEYYWNQLMNFSDAKPYLEWYLYECQHS
ncbi:21724_t:CDS:2, partial [Cetraspora pellucida]